MRGPAAADAPAGCTVPVQMHLAGLHLRGGEHGPPDAHLPRASAGAEKRLRGVPDPASPPADERRRRMKVTALLVGALVLIAPGDWGVAVSAGAALAVSGLALYVALVVRRAGVARLLRRAAADLSAAADAWDAGRRTWRAARAGNRSWADAG